MTLPKNFPGRKQARRQGALERFALRTSRTGKQSMEARAAELTTLKSYASMSVETARAIRTKKDRSARGRLMR